MLYVNSMYLFSVHVHISPFMYRLVWNIYHIYTKYFCLVSLLRAHCCWCRVRYRARVKQLSLMLMTLGSVSVIRSQVPAKTKVQGSYCGQCRSASAAPLYSAGAGTVQSQALRIATHNLASKSPNSQLLSTLTAPWQKNTLISAKHPLMPGQDLYYLGYPLWLVVVVPSRLLHHAPPPPNEGPRDPTRGRSGGHQGQGQGLGLGVLRL